jgi:type IV pilus assembly protein PilQ
LFRRQKEELLLRFAVRVVLCFSLIWLGKNTWIDVLGDCWHQLVSSQELTASRSLAWAQVEEEEQPMVSNVFYDTDLRQAIADIAAQAGVSIIMDETVQGLITVEILDLPLEDALSRMLSPLGFTFRKMNGYYVVGSAYPDSPSFAILSATEVIQLNYLRAQDVPLVLSSFYAPFLRVNQETNTLAVTASPEILARIKEDLSRIDIPPKQIMIEAVVTEFSQDARKELGLDYSWIGAKEGKSLSIIAPFTELLDSTLGNLIYKRHGAGRGWSYDIIGILKTFIDDGKVKIRANPRIATVEGHKATIFIGREQYYSLVTGQVGYQYAQLEKILSGVSLTITPYLAENGDITVEIEPEVADVVGTGTDNLPVLAKRAVKTKIRVPEGETIVIGGLVQETENLRGWKIPILGQIPILGYLFSHTSKVTEKREVIIFLTPHVLTGEETVSESDE